MKNALFGTTDALIWNVSPVISSLGTLLIVILVTGFNSFHLAVSLTFPLISEALNDSTFLPVASNQPKNSYPSFTGWIKFPS